MDEKKIDDGGPAFPCVGEGFGNPHYHAPGMTLRDWFAGQALAGILGNTVAGPSKNGWPVEPCLADAAYRLADAMLAERSKAK